MIFSPRRIPGTLALALTNLIAAWSWFDDAGFRESSLFRVARDFAPLWVWVAAWTVSAVGLVVACCRRSLLILHLAAGLSMATWGAMVAGIFWAKWFDRSLMVTPIAQSLLAWMVLSQLAMFLAPLLHPTVCPPCPDCEDEP
jgi:hypothetical protein